ncbi:MAG: hypothetical protein WCS85_04050 [Candidatus Peribacteraceae bacterium]|jgi:hypothetical protein
MPISSVVSHSSDFDILDAALNGRDHIQTRTSKGFAHISKVPAGYIPVTVINPHGIQAIFRVYSNGRIEEGAGKLFVRQGGGVSKHEHQTPRVNVSEILSEIERSEDY